MNDRPTPDARTTDPMDRLLGDAASRAVPVADARFIARLETNLRVAHASRSGARTRWPIVVAGAALAGLVAVFVFAGAGRDTVVTSVDGIVAGQPDGPRSGPPPTTAGPASADDAVTDDAVEDDDGLGTPGSTAAPDLEPVTTAPGAPSATAPDPEAAAPRGDAPTTTVAPDPGAPSSTAPGDGVPDRPPRDGPGPTSSTPPTTTTTTAPGRPPPTTSAPADRPASLGLRARRSDRNAVLEWTDFDGERFAGWRVTRRATIGDRTVTGEVHRSRDRAERRTTDVPPDGAHDIRYQVVAVDATGDVVARSDWVPLG